MKNNVRRSASAFLKQFNLSEVTLENLSEVIKKQGYTVIEFNNISNSENVDVLLTALGLKDLSKRSKGFTYADSQRRLLFVHESLSDEEKLMVLAHEEGHIYCDHFSNTPIIGRDVVEEHEANEFAHYILHRSMGAKLGQRIKQNKKKYIALAVAIILVITGVFMYHMIQLERSYYGEYYVTTTGNKYHSKDCGFVKDKRNVERFTVEQFESGKYEPCEKCITPTTAGEEKEN